MLQSKFVTFKQTYQQTMTENRNGWKYFIKDFIVAGVSGAVTIVLMAPVYNVNLNINRATSKLDMNTNVYRKNQSFFAYTFKLIQEKGIRQLYKVDSKVILNSFWFQGISFSLKNYLQNLLNFTKHHDGFLRTFLANTLSGVFGGIVALTAVFPFNYPRVMLVQMKGLKDYYKNFSLYLIPNAIYRGLYFGIFDSIKTNSQDEEIDSLMEILAYSISSTLTARILAAPFQAAQFKIIIEKEPKGLRRYIEIVKEQSENSIRKCLQFKPSFIYRTLVGALTLTLYEILTRQFSFIHD